MRSWLLGVAITIATAAPVASEPVIDIPEPTAAAPKVIVEDTPGPLYYRIPSDVVRSLTRSGLGMELRTSGAGFALDMLTGVAIQFGRGSSYGMWIEGGYSYAGFGDHLALLGAGPSLRELSSPQPGGHGLGFALVPHAAIGRTNGQLGYGLRTSAVLTYGGYGVELAHQVLIIGPTQVHELHVVLTVPYFGGSG